ncbi:TetR/AcrR family transcriptional regulator [Paenibacillus oryzisoli]|uniref:TetR/AcrR family transcriptional regulator n=1 Tax=Paenibacillus oryzisoli TaxID=1850517 RepID=UPI003D2BF219
MKQNNETKVEALFDERREQIKKAALKVFAKHGIDGTKMSMIAGEAGISQGLSYRYYASKEEIFTVLVEEALENAHLALVNLGSLPGSPKEQLAAITRNMLDEEHKHYFMLLQHARTSKEVPMQAREAIERYGPNDTLDLIVPIFVKGQQMGEFTTGDPLRILFLYFSVITGLMLQDSEPTQGYWLQEVDRLMKLLSH